MKEEPSLSSKIKNFFITIFTLILSFLKRIFKKNKKENNLKETQNIKIENKQTSKTNNNFSTSTNIDTNNTFQNPQTTTNYESDEQTSNEIILEIPKSKEQQIKTNIKKSSFIINKELIEELIDEALEEIDEHKINNFKVKKATEEQKERIKEIKEKIIPIVTPKVISKKLNTKEELYTEIKKLVQKEIKEKPLLISKKESKESFFLATPLKRETKLKEAPNLKKEDSLITTITPEVKKDIKEKVQNTPFIMVQNVPEIKEPKKEEIKNIAIGASLTAFKAAHEIIKTPLNKEINLKEKTPPKVSKKEAEITTIELPKLKETKNEVSPKQITIQKDIPSLPQEEVIPIIVEEKEEDKIESKEEKKEIKEEDQKEKKSNYILDPQIERNVNQIISDTQTESKKEDIEDKEYDKIEQKIDRMLDDIEKTYLRYKENIPPNELKKLQKEETKLRKTKQDIHKQKNTDLETEQKRLNELITETEKKGLNEEIKRLHIEHQLELNKYLLDDITKIESLNKDKAAEIEKQITLRNLKKASIAAEVGSLLTLPFIHNRFFLFFTASLIVSNHLNFISNLFRRKKTKYNELDLNAIQKGEDALNNALGQTYDNIDKLNIVEKNILTKYPEMAYDPKFIKYITKLKTNLYQNYNKLIKKKEIMEHYRLLSKKSTKIYQKKYQ